MRKAIWVATTLFIVLVVATYFASPYWALYQIRSAAAAGQGEQVAKYVDFPALRESVKAQFVQSMAKRMDSKARNSPFAALGQGLALQMVNGLVDAMISPEAIANMIASGKAPKATLDRRAGSTPVGDGASREPDVRRGYQTLDTFEAALVDPRTEEDLLTVVLSRQGFFAWKLTAVRIPALLKP